MQSRFNIVNVKAPSREHMPQVMRSIYKKILAANPWGHKFNALLSDQVIQRLLAYSPREANNLMMLALGKAAVSGSAAINPTDIPICDSGETKIRMGFL